MATSEKAPPAKFGSTSVKPMAGLKAFKEATEKLQGGCAAWHGRATSWTKKTNDNMKYSINISYIIIYHNNIYRYKIYHTYTHHVLNKCKGPL